ncbi:DivIVA domain-containing protein [Tsukamurella hominis]|uniref:DivIVA domain-containing protein n=1 Tax=Tsukamurella hominis TaxID=1970232 RepID=UPI0039E7410F
MVIVLYALGLLAVAAVLYGVAALVFGRGDDTPPLETGATPTVLPAEDVAGADVRALRFQQVVRGYKPAEVDWALERLAREIDVLRARLAAEQEPAATATEAPAETD